MTSEYKRVKFPFLLPASIWTFVHFYWQLYFKSPFLPFLARKWQQMTSWNGEKAPNPFIFPMSSFLSTSNQDSIGKPIRCLAMAWRVLNLGPLSWHISWHILSMWAMPFLPLFSSLLLIAFSHSVNQILTSPFSRRILLLTWLVKLPLLF